MIKPIIADSSALISLVSVTDQNHSRAIKISQNIAKTNRSIILPGEIFTETVNTIGKKQGHKKAILIAEDFLEDKEFILADTTSLIRDLALEKFRKQPDSVSFTDCLAMAFADHFETKEIFGFDEAFAKSGYKRLGIDRL